MCYNYNGDNMTTIYLMKHSIGLKEKEENNVNESLQISNEKIILSVEGEILAQKYSELDELQNLNMVYSSNYVRAMSTAKYVSYKNNKKLIVDENFGERKFGIKNWKELPKDFFVNQLLDENYKLNDGESKKEVFDRMNKSFEKVLKYNKNKKALIVSHGSAITFLLEKWCDISYDNGYVIYYGNKFILDDFTSPDLIKLEFDKKNELINVDRIKLK